MLNFIKDKFILIVIWMALGSFGTWAMITTSYYPAIVGLWVVLFFGPIALMVFTPTLKDAEWPWKNGDLRFMGEIFTEAFLPNIVGALAFVALIILVITLAKAL